MKKALPALLLPLLVACSSAPAAKPDGAAPAAEAPVPGVAVIAPYEGVFKEHHAVAAAVAALPEAARDAEIRLRERLGLYLDPDRPPVLELTDGIEEPSADSRIVEGRSVVTGRIPSAPLAQGREDLTTLVTGALCRAALEQGGAALPGWYRAGAPLWISGAEDRLLYRRVLGSAPEAVEPEELVPDVDPTGRQADALSAALFVRFLAEEFGADRLPSLTHALLTADSFEDALAAALQTDPASLPVAFDGFRRRVVGDITADPVVTDLGASRRLSPEDRIARLTGLDRRAGNPFVAASALEDLGLAEFESGDFEAAANTLARVEREFPRHSLHPDRVRLVFALTFARRGEPLAAALRLDTFLTEFPQSEVTDRALWELAAALRELDREDEAMVRLKELVRRFPGGEWAEKALLALAEEEIRRHRYAVARAHLLRAGASQALIDLDARLAGGLPAAAVPLVKTAVRDLAAPDPALRQTARTTLLEVGPIASRALLAALWDAGDGAPLLLRQGVLDVARQWPLYGAQPVLADLLADPSEEIAEGALTALLEMGETPAEVRRMLDLHGDRAATAVRLFRERFGGDQVPPEVWGLMGSEDFQRRIEAARVLAGNTRPETISALKILASDPSPQVRGAAVAALGARSEPAAAPLLAAALDDTSPIVRLTAVGSLAGRKLLDPIREKGMADPDTRVKLVSARVLYENRATVGDLAAVVSLLGDGDAGVRSGVEAMLRAGGYLPPLGDILPEALLSADSAGTATRLVRVMGHLAATDFGYDPLGGQEERKRVAAAFRQWTKERER